MHSIWMKKTGRIISMFAVMAGLILATFQYATHRFFSTPSLPSNDVGFRLVSPGV